MQIQPIDPNKPLSATLTAQEWNAVMAAVDELPGRICRPILGSLMAQLSQQSQTTTEDMPEHALQDRGLI